jgi:hypothetical protein
VVLWPLQWPFFYCYAADRKSKLLLFRESDKKPNSIAKLAEGLKCLILWFSIQLTTLVIILLATILAAWRQAAFQGEGNVSYLHQLGCLSYGPRPSHATSPRNKHQQQLQEEGRKEGGFRQQPNYQTIISFLVVLFIIFLELYTASGSLLLESSYRLAIPIGLLI